MILFVKIINWQKSNGPFIDSDICMINLGSQRQLGQKQTIRKSAERTLEMYDLWNCSLLNMTLNTRNGLTKFMRCETYVL